MTEGPDLPLTPDDVAEIVALLDGSAYDALELNTGRFGLKIARSASGGWTQDWRHTATQTNVVQSPTESRPLDDDASTKVPSEELAGLFMIRAPLPGVFYSAPRPGAAPFVELAGHVGHDTVVAIIETMKMMNSVQAGADGVVVDILVRNGDMVAKDAALMRIRPDG